MWGPQPPEALLSEICEAFGCTPDVAADQDYEEVMAILDYRNARTALTLFRMKDRKAAFERLAAEPELSKLIGRMQRAQLDQGPADDDTLAAEGEAAIRKHVGAEEEG